MEILYGFIYIMVCNVHLTSESGQNYIQCNYVQLKNTDRAEVILILDFELQI